MRKKFTTDDTDGTDSIQSGMLSSVPSVPSVVPTPLHPGNLAEVSRHLRRRACSLHSCPFVSIRVHSWFKWSQHRQMRSPAPFTSPRPATTVRRHSGKPIFRRRANPQKKTKPWATNHRKPTRRNPPRNRRSRAAPTSRSSRPSPRKRLPQRRGSSCHPQPLLMQSQETQFPRPVRWSVRSAHASASCCTRHFRNAPGGRVPPSVAAPSAAGSLCLVSACTYAPASPSLPASRIYGGAIFRLTQLLRLPVSSGEKRQLP